MLRSLKDSLNFFVTNPENFRSEVFCLPLNDLITFLEILFNHFMPLVSFYIPLKHQRNTGFLMFSGGIEKDQ